MPLIAAVSGALLVHAAAASSSSYDFLHRRDAVESPRTAALPPIEPRVQAALANMSLAAKVAQTLQLSDGDIVPANTTRYEWLMNTFGATGVGSMTSGFIGTPPGFINGIDATNAVQASFLSSSGIPILVWTETLHTSQGAGVIFPAPGALGSTWNTQLVHDVAAVIGYEARLQGISQSFSPELQVATDPRFGRTEEAFGEDPFLVSAIGAAYATGIQGDITSGPDTYANWSALVTEAKHLAAYAQAGMDSMAVNIDNATLFNVYLRPWRDYFQVAGGRGAMISHQALNNVPNHANAWLMTDVMRGMFGANHSFFSSDDDDVKRIWTGFGLAVDCDTAAALTLSAGLDQDLGPVCYQNLAEVVTSGMVDEAALDRAVSNILRAKFAAGLFDGAANGTVNASAYMDSPPHRALAYQAAAEASILLKNDGALLPLDVGGAIRRVAVIGPNAGCAGGASNCGYGAINASPLDAQHGCYVWDSSRTVTVLQAVNESALNGTIDSVTFVQGANWTSYETDGIAAAVAAAQEADIVIAVVGDTWANYGQGTCAEGIDADTIDLAGGQLALLDAITSNSSTPVVAVLIHGRPLTFGAGPFASMGRNNALLDRIPAVLATWRPGEEGGHAIWDILRGVVNPSGRLAQNWLRNAGAVRGPASPWMQPRRNGLELIYVTEPVTPLFPFGYGLSYSNYTLGNSITVTPAAGSGPLVNGSTFTVTGSISSVGPAGLAVIQLYASQNVPTKYVRFSLWLACFAKVAVPANAAPMPWSMTCRVDDLDAYDPDVGAYVTYTGNYTLIAALHSAQAAATPPATATVPLQGSYNWVPPYWRQRITAV